MKYVTDEDSDGSLIESGNSLAPRKAELSFKIYSSDQNYIVESYGILNDLYSQQIYHIPCKYFPKSAGISKYLQTQSRQSKSRSKADNLYD